MAEVILKNVSKVYDGNVVAVKDVNLDIKDKEFAVLVGPSGCGKSTTLRMVAGLEDITEGEITIDGRVINDVQPKDRDIAMVFQNYALYPHMTVEENMSFGLKLRKLPKKEIKERVAEAAEILGLTDYLKRKPKALSGGQRQRVAIGRVIVRKPKVFLFDEPLSNLDAKLRVQMRTELIKIHSKLQVTSIYVTHDQVEAMTMGTMIVVMNNKVVQQVGTPLDVYKHPQNKFVAGFIGSPQMNFIPAEIKEKNKVYSLDCGDFELKLPAAYNECVEKHVGRHVIFGIRPKDIYDKSVYPGQVDGNNVVANVEVVEHLGAEEYVYFATNRANFVANYDPSIILHIGDKNKEVVFEMKNAHIFDAETEMAILG